MIITNKYYYCQNKKYNQTNPVLISNWFQNTRLYKLWLFLHSGSRRFCIESYNTARLLMLLHQHQIHIWTDRCKLRNNHAAHFVCRKKAKEIGRIDIQKSAVTKQNTSWWWEPENHFKSYQWEQKLVTVNTRLDLFLLSLSYTWITISISVLFWGYGDGRNLYNFSVWRTLMWELF